MYANIGGPGAKVTDAARDIFRFLTLADAGATGPTGDEVYGFVRGAGQRFDRIDLSPIDANPSVGGNQKFKLVNAFTAAKGEVHLRVAGQDTIVEVDGDNDTAIDMTIRVIGVSNLGASDLIL